MSSLIKTLLNGITSMTSTESQLEEKENKMFNFTTTVEEIDRENEALITAAGILESLGNYPGLSTDEFYDKLQASELPEDLHESVTMAAIAIEMMMTADKDFEFDTTVH